MNVIRSGRVLSVSVAALAACALPGCIGIGYLGMREKPGAPVKDVRALRDHPAPLTTADLRAEFGEPDERRERRDGSERWTYDGVLCFSGVVVWTVIPIPLALPIRRESDTYHVEEGHVLRVDRIEFHERHATCGLIPGLCVGFGCDTWGTPE